jgi:hypothetical protein
MCKQFAPLQFDFTIIQRLQTVAELAQLIELRTSQLHAASVADVVAEKQTEREVIRL